MDHRLQRMKVVVAELQEIAQEEENVIAELLQLTQDDTGKVRLSSQALALGLSLTRFSAIFALHLPNRASFGRWLKF